MKELKSTRLAAGEAILELIQEGKDVVAVSADTYKSMYTSLVKDNYPERFVDVGIAEQNMMMVAVGLASTGRIAYAASYSVFTSMRCCEQLRTFMAYPNLNVKVIAGIGGFSAGIEGVTHVATEDLGVVRCIANACVIAPCDAVTTKMAVKAAADYHGLVYIRVGRDPSKVLVDESYEFEIGKPFFHKKGKDVTLIGCGIVMEEVFEAQQELEEQGIDTGVIEIHTLKPVLEQQAILEEILKTKHVITVEEHNVVGGLASVISEITQGLGGFETVNLGLKDCFAQTGTPQELRVKYKVDKDSIVKAAKDLVK